MPTHWNAAGEVDGWSSRAVGAFLMPTVALGLWLLFLVLPRLDPRRANYERFGRTYDLVVAAVVVFQVAVHVLTLGAALGWPIAVDTVIIVGVGLLLLLLGNVLPRVRPNWFIGIRTPWTLSSDRAWERTHRVGGYIFSAAGLVVVAAAALPDAWKVWVIVAAAAAASLGTVVYSYFAWKQETAGSSGQTSKLVLLVLVPWLALFASPLRAGDPPASGLWHGEIELPNQAGRLGVTVELGHQEGEDGAWKGDIDIPAQGARDLPLEGIAVDGSKVRFSIAGIPGAPTFDGAIVDGEIRGIFTQGGFPMPFRLARADPNVPLGRLQEPRPPFPYTAEEAAYTNGDIRLAGTLTIPAGPGPFPAVLLVTGSGAQDRDESAFAHKSFLVLADHLSRNGIAVLRVDDRGIGGSSGSIQGSTTANFAQDALAGVRFLKKHPRIAPDRVGLVGHSEGGIVAPLAASQSPDVAFIVMLAGTGVPGAEILHRQTELIVRASGAPEDQVKATVDVMRRQTAAVQTEKDPEKLAATLRTIAQEQIATWSEQERKAAGGGDAIEVGIKFASSPWFRSFVGHDPRPALRQVKVPVLALNGELDVQVSPDQNLPEIEKSLQAAGNRDVTIRQMPGLNHLFQPAKTGSPAEYELIETTMDPAVLDLVTR